jgi:hypothetical protein
VLIILLASPICSFGAGWSDAWDYGVTWGGTYETNLNAVKVTDSFSITTSETNIFEHSLFSLYGQSGSYTFPACTGTTCSLVNEYYAYTRYVYTNNNSLSTTIVTTASSSYFDDDWNLHWVSNTMTRTLEGGVFTININIHERRQLELYEALYERGAVANYISFGHGFLYDNTVVLKSMLASIVNSYCNTGIVQQAAITNWGHNDISVVVTNGGVVSTNILPSLYWNRTNILESSGLPSNYFSYTPRKSPAHTLGFGRTITTCVEIIRYPGETNVPPGGTLTNQVVLYDGTVTNVVGQEGTTNCVSITYTNIADGFVDSDYTYWAMTNIIGKLTCVAAEGRAYAGVNTAVYGYINSNTNKTRTRTTSINYSYSDYPYSGVPWYYFCENPLWPGDTCSSNNNYSSTPSFVYETTSYTGSILGHLQYKISGTRQTSVSSIDVDYDCDGGSSFTETQDYSGSQLDFQYYYNRVGVYTGYYSSITGAKTGSVMNAMIADYYLFDDDKATRTYSNKNVYSISYSSNLMYSCVDYLCDNSSIGIPGIYGQPTATNYIVYTQNVNPLYKISDSNYCLAKSFYSVEIVPTGSSYTIELDLAEPYSEAQMASEYAFSTLDEYSISASSSSCVTNPSPYRGIYCRQSTGSGYYKKEHTTYYVDASIKSIRHIINYAVTNGFKYY